MATMRSEASLYFFSMYSLTIRKATAGSVVVPDLEMTMQATLRSATRSISSARYSSDRLLPANTTSAAAFLPPN